MLSAWQRDDILSPSQIDPDAPERNEDGTQPGRHGPWLHWIVTNAKARLCACCASFAPQRPALNDEDAAAFQSS